jgi:hypothetical protein
MKPNLSNKSFLSKKASTCLATPAAIFDSIQQIYLLIDFLGFDKIFKAKLKIPQLINASV